MLALSPYAGEYLINKKLFLSIDLFRSRMDAEELRLATEMSSWMATVEARLTVGAALSSRQAHA